jgi:hypothetical protein
MAAALLYAPLAAAAWSSRAMACCTGDHCDIPQHHHQRATDPASGASEGPNCGHEMNGMMGCTMSCCQDTDRPVVTAVLFVLPHPVFAPHVMQTKRADDARRSVEIPRATEPLSPPPRVVVAAL